MKRFVFLFVICSLFFISNANASLLFFDNFNTEANPEWGNEIGQWKVDNGVYFTDNGSSSPHAYTSITSFPNLRDFFLDVDVNLVSDGGIWLRSSHNSITNQSSGVLLVTGGGGGGLYWHITNEGDTGAIRNRARLVGESNIHLKVDVQGDVYRAYLNGATTPVTELITNAFPSGYVGLYSFSSQTFDNLYLSDFNESPVVPEPSTVFLFGSSFVGMFLRRRR